MPKYPPLTTVARGLRFPEGPVWISDGTVALVEIERRTVTLVRPDGRADVLSEHEGGPNGLAIGPDGALYVCNCGGFAWETIDGILTPVGQSPRYGGGSIERVDAESGRVSRLYDNCGGRPLSGPNDLVFDAFGGFYFTDIGKIRERDRDHGGVYYAQADGSGIVEVAYPILSPNGCGLSPNGRTLYVADMEPARLWAFEILSPGVARKHPFPQSHNGGTLVAGLGTFQGFDSLAVDSAGRICIGTVWSEPQITVIAPQGGVVAAIPMPDPFPTNIAFGGADRTTAFITLSGTGELVSMPWDRAGLRLNYEA